MFLVYIACLLALVCNVRRKQTLFKLKLNYLLSFLPRFPKQF